MSNIDDDILEFANNLGKHALKLDESRSEYDRARLACEEERKRLQSLCEQYNGKVFDAVFTKRENVAMQILAGVASRNPLRDGGQPTREVEMNVLRNAFRLADMFLAIAAEEKEVKP